MASSDYRFRELACGPRFPKKIPRCFSSASMVIIEELGTATGGAEAVADDAEYSRQGRRGGRETGSGPASGPDVNLRIFHFNDLHHHLDDNDAGMLSLIEQRMRRAEEAGDKVLTVSAGDDHVGTLYDALIEFAAPGEERSAAYRVHSALPVDFLTVGNHEFDFGFETLAHIMDSDAGFPVFTANIRHPDFPGYAAMIGDMEGLRVGVAGVATLDELHVREDPDSGIFFEDPIDYFSELLNYLSGKIDLLLVVSHLGLFLGADARNDRAVAKLLSEKSAVPSLIIGAHSHTVIDPSEQLYKIEGIPVFQTGAYGSAFGELRLSLGRKGSSGQEWSGSSKVNSAFSFRSPACSIEGTLVKVSSAGTDASGVRKAVKEESDRLKPFLELPGGRLRPAGDESSGGSDSSGGANPPGKSDKFFEESPTANAITDALLAVAELLASDAGIDTDGDNVLAACDTTGYREWLPEDSAEHVRVRDWYRIIPYADTVYCGWIARRDLDRLLQANVPRLLPKEVFEEYGGAIQLEDWDVIMRGRLHFSRNLRYRVRPAHGDDPEAIPSVRERLIDYKFPGEPHSISLASSRGSSSGKGEDSGEGSPILLLLSSGIAMGDQGWRDDAIFPFPKEGFADSGITIRRAMTEAARRGHVFPFTRDGRFSFSD